MDTVSDAGVSVTSKHQVAVMKRLNCFIITSDRMKALLAPEEIYTVHSRAKYFSYFSVFTECCNAKGNHCTWVLNGKLNQHFPLIHFKKIISLRANSAYRLVL